MITSIKEHQMGVGRFELPDEVYRDCLNQAKNEAAAVLFTTLKRAGALVYSCGLRARRECKRWHGMMGPSASCCP